MLQFRVELKYKVESKVETSVQVQRIGRKEL